MASSGCRSRRGARIATAFRNAADLRHHRRGVFSGEGARDGLKPGGNYFDFGCAAACASTSLYLAYVLVSAIIVTVVKWDGGLTLSKAGMRLISWVNPLTFGAGHTWKMLSWHLWFVAPFLFVTALMPFITVKQTPSFVRPDACDAGGSRCARARKLRCQSP